MSNELIYLASPYTHDDTSVCQRRYEDAMRARALLMNQGHMVYSPIVDCHEMACRHTLPTHWEYWKEFDELMIERCDRLWILTIDGWQQSRGVQAEIEIAQRLNKPIACVAIYGEGVSVFEWEVAHETQQA